MNRVVLIGNLTDRPQSRQTESGVAVCTFRLAVNRRFANRQGVKEADFIPIVAWRQMADLCAGHLQKGRKCAVVGQLQTRSYEAQDGVKRYVTEVVADEVEFLGGSQGREDPPPEEAPACYGHSNGEFVEEQDDELPF